MNDKELKRTFRLYRPVVPPPSLRSMSVRRRPGRVVAASAWVPTAAALMAAAALYWLSAHERAAVQLNVDQATVARAAIVGLVSRSLGGGPQSLLVAEFVVLLDEPKARESER
jgi:hypothetical protein